MKLSVDSRYKLNNGVEMPCLGLGTWKTNPGRETKDACLTALNAGYRMIDTAAMYGNERDVGAAVRECGIPRDEIFVTTKLWNSDHGYDQALKAFDHSIKTLDLDYVDLYLIHWPGGGKRSETWRAFEKILKEGKCRAIGVSNFTIRHIQEMDAYATVPPAVDQVELHPYLFQRDLIEYCHGRNMQVESYSPLTHGNMLEEPALLGIAEKYGKQVAQVLIRWGLQHGLIEIPKAAHPDHILANLDVFDFELSAEDMRSLDALSRGYRVTWNPEEIP
ncbi:MAG: aldo/keto reductase [Methanomassiliicoccales archaeon]|nr:aldo/keto reductase [Methanomassiliicoccales archaeon]